MRRNTFATNEMVKTASKAAQAQVGFFKERVRQVLGKSGVPRVSEPHSSTELRRRDSYFFASGDILS